MQTSSVSQGTFLFSPNNFSLSKLKKNRKRKLNDVKRRSWEEAFFSVWDTIYKEVKEVNEQLFKNVLDGLIKHVKTLYSNVKLDEGVLPCEILLTGTNLPDHNLLVSALTDNIKEVTPYISVLWSRNCGNIKTTVTSLVQQIITSKSEVNDVNNKENDDETSDSEGESVDKHAFQASQYNMSTLCAWHSCQTQKTGKNQVVIIFVPDFESYSATVLAELIPILSSYASQVPFILILGVATTPGAVYQCLPHNVLSHLTIQLFKSESSMSFLNQVVEKILFSEKCPFRLGSKCMTFLTDIFLFHSFSVQGFIQGFKLCMMEHFYEKNHFSLCCSTESLDKRVKELTEGDIEAIRRIPSFQRHVEKSPKETRKLLLLDNDHTKGIVKDMVKEVQEYLSNFHVALKCLHILTQDLPQYPLGRHLREYYCSAVSKDIRETPGYKECMRALRYQSRNELALKISLIIELLKLNSLLDILSLDKNTTFDDISSSLEVFKRRFDAMAESEDVEDRAVDDGPNEFETVRNSVLDFIEKELMEKMLSPVTTLPLYEVILFDDLPAIRRRISGSPRGAIHLALNNPQYYLDCKCCTLPHAEAVLPTLPDLSIAYKLHLEFGKVINLYDWLQAFGACVKPEQSESELEADEELQARFTRAVSELQFLGFIKPSRSKTDHVNRLTWGSA